MLKNLPINQLLQQMPHVMPNFCDKCGNRHSKEDVEVMGQEQDKLSLRLTCNNCGSTYMIQIQSPADGVLAAKKTASRSDVSSGEAKNFIGAGDIHPDEILEVYSALKDVTNISDFEVLFLEQHNA